MKLVKQIRTESTHVFSLKSYRAIKNNSLLSMVRFAIFCIIVLNLLTGCGGGKGGSNNPTPTPTPIPALTWSEPTLPTKFNTNVIPSARTPLVVNLNTGLQAAIDQALPGDTIHLPPNIQFKGNYILRKKTGNDFITIRTSSPDSLLPPEHNIILPSRHLSAVAHMISPNDKPVLTAENGAHHYRFIGIEFTNDRTAAQSDTLIDLGSSANNVDELPNNIIFDRVFIHGFFTTSIRRGIALNGTNMAVVDSFLSDFHKDDDDAMAIQIWNGQGPYKIEHNILEASSEAVMIGGTVAKIQNVVPADIEFTFNLCFRSEDPTRSDNNNNSIERMSYIDGSSTSKPWNPEKYANNTAAAISDKWKVGSLIDVRNAQRMLIERNFITGAEYSNQNAFSVSLAVRTENGSMPSAVVKEITFIENTVRNSGSAIFISGKDDNGQGLGQHVKITNNAFDSIDGNKFKGDGIFVKLANAPSLIKIDHNTAINSGNTGLITGSNKGQVLIFTNNVVYNNQNGFAGEGQGTGTSALNFYYPNSFTFSGNVLVGGNSTLYPSGNNFPAAPFNPGVVYDSDLTVFVKTGTIGYTGTDGKNPGFEFDAYINRFWRK